MAQDLYHRSIFHLGTLLKLDIRRARRKTLAIHVRPEGIEVKVPMKCPWTEVDGFIESRLDWLVSAWHQMSAMPVAAKFLSGEQHEYLGKLLPLEVTPAGTNHLFFSGDALLMKSKRPDCHEHNQGVYFQFLRQQSLRVLPERLAACEARFPVPVRHSGLRIRRMRARWGSCSESGEICLNSMLLQKAPQAIDLVINHELCHLRHFHHDAAFYALMDKAMPDWREVENLLKVAPEMARPASGQRHQLELF
jgi:hypothetical protein